MECVHLVCLNIVEWGFFFIVHQFLDAFFSSFFLSGNGKVPWEYMHGLMENAIYGGRIDNTFDINVLRSYLLQFFDTALYNQVWSRCRLTAVTLGVRVLVCVCVCVHASVRACVCA